MPASRDVRRQFLPEIRRLRRRRWRLAADIRELAARGGHTVRRDTSDAWRQECDPCRIARACENVEPCDLGAKNSTRSLVTSMGSMELTRTRSIGVSSRMRRSKSPKVTRGVKIAAVGADIDSAENNFANAGRGELIYFRHDYFRRQAAALAANERNYAVGAARVAAILNFERWPGVISPLRQKPARSGVACARNTPVRICADAGRPV